MSTKNVHAILPAAAIVLGIPLLAGLIWFWWDSTKPYDVPAGQDVFSVAQGVWAWTTSDSGCRATHHTISFSSDRRLMYYTTNRKIKAATGTEDSVFVYDVLSYDRHSIRAAMRGETRRTSRGQLVVWDLVLKAHDTYAWHEADWPPRVYTAAIRRCSEADLAPR